MTSNSKSECATCGRDKANRNCQICENPTCKKCLHILEAGAFSFLETIPKELSHDFYCEACYEENIVSALETYKETLEKAKNVFVFFKTQRKEIPLIKKSRDTFTIQSCPDRDETILRLAFFAAERGYNALVETEALSTKVHNESYQTSVWRGTGTAANIDAAKLERQDFLKRMYR